MGGGGLGDQLQGWGIVSYWGMGSGVINLHVLIKVGDFPSTFIGVGGGAAGISSWVRVLVFLLSWKWGVE